MKTTRTNKKFTADDIIKSYTTKNNKNSLVLINDGSLLCTYLTPKKTKKAVFITEELTIALYRQFWKQANHHHVDSLVVYCTYAYMDSQNLEIILNRESY
ncbi:hypothetical protein DFLDMN_001647 [Cupriavidus sp. H19C3]|uniref:hypothetical protein n=1 Tax=Cupriavidus sp. H19C3 TaxID=3241603 RepID=UPI003BF83144